MKHLWTAWDDLKQDLSVKKKKLVFLDFDGTLVSIADSPGEVRMEPATRTVLKALSKDPNTRLAIVSGRPLKELRHFLPKGRIILIGNQGLEIHGRGMSLPAGAKEARRLARLIHLLSQKFRIAFSSYPGTWIEDKHYTLSLHFRKLPRGQGAMFSEMVRFYRNKYKKYPLDWTRGKKVIEIRPSVFWGKGDAVAHLMKKFPRMTPLAIGDDRVDEGMFKVLNRRGGISVRVGRSGSSSAAYFLSSPSDVRVLLNKLYPVKDTL